MDLQGQMVICTAQHVTHFDEKVRAVAEFELHVHSSGIVPFFFFFFLLFWAQKYAAIHNTSSIRH